MNGRVYDAALGRFIQADPVVDGVTDTQGYNRYSYVKNNPLSYTDPTGYSSVSRAWKKWGKVAVAIVLSVVTYGAASAWAAGWLASSVAAGTISATTAGVVAGAVGGAAAGAVAGAITSGNMNGAVRGAFSGAVTGGIAGYFGDTYSLTRVAADGIGNGIAAEIGGGSFRDGMKMGLAVSLATYANVKLREYELNHSKGTPGQVGNSPGFRGVEGKLGGGRIVEKYWNVTGKKALERGESIETALAEYYAHPEVGVSPLGGHQGGQGIMFSDKLTYQPGGFQDYLVEGFAGTHDALNHWYHYNPNGTAIHRDGLGGVFGEVLNAANVVVATPLVAPSL